MEEEKNCGNCKKWARAGWGLGHCEDPGNTAPAFSFMKSTEVCKAHEPKGD